MGIIIEKSSIVSSAAALAALALGAGPLLAFMTGVASLLPVKMLFGGSPVSQTGMFASLGAIFSFNYMGVTPLHAFLLGTACGYFYLYWWLFIYPRIIGK